VAIADAKNVLAQLESSPHSIELRKIHDLRKNIRSIDLGKPDSATHEVRDAKTRLILRLLKQVDARIDPKFNPDDAPLLNVPPPVGGAPSGVSPTAIPDPEERRMYNLAIQRNQQKSREYSDQVDL